MIGIGIIELCSALNFRILGNEVVYMPCIWPEYNFCHLCSTCRFMLQNITSKTHANHQQFAGKFKRLGFIGLDIIAYILVCRHINTCPNLQIFFIFSNLTCIYSVYLVILHLEIYTSSCPLCSVLINKVTSVQVDVMHACTNVWVPVHH